MGKEASYKLAYQQWQEKLKTLLVEPAADPKLTLWLTRYQTYRQASIGVNLSPKRFASSSSALSTFQKWYQGNPCPFDEFMIESYFCFLAGKISSGEWSSTYGNDLFGHFRLFVLWCSEMGLVEQPRNINSRRYKFRVIQKEIRIIPSETLSSLLNSAKDEVLAYVLLALNCGFTSKDILDLQDSEVDWTEGEIRRRRSKTKHIGNAPLVTYKLWDKTFSLLKTFRSGKETVFSIGFDQKIQREFGKLVSEYSFKHLRKTAASLLNEKYPQFTQYFLGHSSKSVAETHYVKPNDQEFGLALDWLKDRIGISSFLKG
jgi:integrase